MHLKINNKHFQGVSFQSWFSLTVGTNSLLTVMNAKHHPSMELPTS